MNRFDKPYRLLSTQDPKKVMELFNLVNDLDTNELLQYSFNNQISFDVINENGDSLIHEVVRMDNRKTNQHSKLNVIKFLVQNGVNPDTPNKMNQTPLHIACNYQLDLIVKYLLSINVNPNYTDNMGMYPFHYLFFGEIKIVGNSDKVLDFVEPPKEGKTDFIDKKEIIEIKRKLWELIKDKKFFIDMKNKIDTTLTSPYGDIDKKYQKIFDLFKDFSKDPNMVRTSQILDQIKAFNSSIINSAKSFFNKFKNLDEIIIHTEPPTRDSIIQKQDMDNKNFYLLKNIDDPQVAGFDANNSAEHTNLYKFELSGLIKDIIQNQIDTGVGAGADIKSKISEYLEKNNLNKSNREVIIYYILCKLIEEIAKQELDVYLTNKVIEYTKTIANHANINIDFFKTKEMGINLTSTSIDLEIKICTTGNNIKNIYSVIKNPNKIDHFIIYQNDFNNTSKFKIKNSFYINDKIISILLENHSLLFKPSLDGFVPIDSLLKINNNKIIKELSSKLGELGIKMKDFIGDNSIKIIKKECENNLNKVLNNYEGTKPIIEIFKNINDYLYNDIKLLITSNENFGNNILKYLEESFSICSYLTLQYMSEHLGNIDTNFTFNRLEKLFKLCNFEIDNININYLESIIEDFNIHEDDETYITKIIMNEKNEEAIIIKNELEKIEKSLCELGSRFLLKNKLQETKNNYENKYSKLKNDIKKIKDILESRKDLPYITSILHSECNSYYPNISMIEKYKNISNSYSMNEAWTRILNTKEICISDNYNLILLKMLIKEKDFLKGKNNEEIGILNHGFEHISKLCESYFNKNNYTDENDALEFIKEMLEYLTNIIICNGIEYMVRKILFIYFSNSSYESDIESVTVNIEYIINSKIISIDKTLLEILHTDICTRLVKSSVNIFQNQAEQNLYNNESISDILLEFFEHFNIFDNMLSNEIKKVFTSNVVSYFNSFTSRTILLWMINAENIFKFFINNYRSTDILLELTK